jgi:leucyl aminopeptidase
VKIIKDKELLKQNFPMIFAVGQASPRRPQLVEIKWKPTGKTKKLPKIALVGKGMVYDTGGLNIKTGAGMRDMKKDMGGAAHALGVASMIMALNIPVELQVLLPIAENAISGNSYRPGDILDTRKGITVEIEDTDAEGRLVVADALTYACEHKPELIIDFCTLTGAARVAVGYDIPAFFSNRDKLIDDLRHLSVKSHDPIWPFPLWEGYDGNIEGNISDIRNEGTGRAGHIEAALFLQRFILPAIDWVHLDCFAWERNGKPGRPHGGADTGMLTIFNYIKNRYS